MYRGLAEFYLPTTREVGGPKKYFLVGYLFYRLSRDVLSVGLYLVRHDVISCRLFGRSAG